jgi:hypothetical protein
MKESPLRGDSAPTAGQRYLTGMQQRSPVRKGLIFQSGFYAVTAPASGSSTKTALVVNAQSHTQGSLNKCKCLTRINRKYEARNPWPRPDLHGQQNHPGMSRQGRPKQIQILNAQMFKTVRAVSRAIENVRIAYRFLVLNFCHSILFRISNLFSATKNTNSIINRLK